MGTRADFYVGSGEQAEWIGSIGCDGYPEGIVPAIFTVQTADDYRQAVQAFLADREDATYPDHGWPWPWDDSTTTDYAYMFVEGQVQAWRYGQGPFDPRQEEPRGEPGARGVFPHMAARRNLTFGRRSGLLLLQVPQEPR